MAKREKSVESHLEICPSHIRSSVDNVASPSIKREGRNAPEGRQFFNYESHYKSSSGNWNAFNVTKYFTSGLTTGTVWAL